MRCLHAIFFFMQPYRTTPLILPGAKVKKDVTPTESYLRHHPNPAMRGPTHHIDDFLMKQKVLYQQLYITISLKNILIS